MGSLEGQFKDLSTELGKVKVEQNQQLKDMSKQLEGLGAQVGKMGSNFEEIKVFMMSMQRKDDESRAKQINSRNYEAETTVTEEIYNSYTGENSTPLYSINPPFNSIYSMQQPVTHLNNLNGSHHTPTTPLSHPHTAPIYSMTPLYMAVTMASSTPPFNRSGATHTLPHQILIPPPNFSHQGFSHIPLYSHPSHNLPPPSPQPPNIHFNPMPKLEFPKFDGNDPKGWLTRMDQYFDFIPMDDIKKVKLAGLYCEGKANIWFRFYISSRISVP